MVVAAKGGKGGKGVEEEVKLDGKTYREALTKDWIRYIRGWPPSKLPIILFSFESISFFHFSLSINQF